jgi:3-methyladenine DNA glycosylase AlkD
MRNHFSFFGIKTEGRRLIFKNICKENNKELIENPREIALILYFKPERELHYCAIEILIKQLKGNYKKDDIQLIENLIITNAWWDSVDTIAKYILGEYLLEYPLETGKVMKRFSNSDNMWLNRSAILFQLGYKQKDLAKALGQKSRVSEVLNKKRKLSIEMIRKLHETLGIPSEVLIRDY